MSAIQPISWNKNTSMMMIGGGGGGGDDTDDNGYDDTDSDYDNIIVITLHCV